MYVLTVEISGEGGISLLFKNFTHYFFGFQNIFSYLIWPRSKASIKPQFETIKYKNPSALINLQSLRECSNNLCDTENVFLS